MQDAHHVLALHKQLQAKGVMGEVGDWHNDNTFSPQEWAVYYAHWYLRAAAAATATTCTATDCGNLRKVVQLRLNHEGWVTRLPDCDGSLWVSLDDDTYVLRFTVLFGTDTPSTITSVACIAGISHRDVQLPVDWDLCLAAIPLLKCIQ